MSASSRGGGGALTADQLESPTYSEVNNRSWNNEDEYNSEGSEGSDHHVQSPQASTNEASTEAGLSETSTEEETPEERMEVKMRVELFEKSKDGDLAGVRGLLLALQVLSTERDESAVDYRDEDGMTILHWAAREGHQEVVDYLITSAGADVLDRDSKGLRSFSLPSIHHVTRHIIISQSLQSFLNQSMDQWIHQFAHSSIHFLPGTCGRGIATDRRRLLLPLDLGSQGVRARAGNVLHGPSEASGKQRVPRAAPHQPATVISEEVRLQA